ncbi:putative amino acid transporter [Sclerotinia borealis F-4128]|uniref:Putative amino acid transporter n=1 Tax=Sclerotinia borealis (strain F-4128) TaxID=1432307 RepID=W9CT50_SCLBF|nr:putative amino acid transporter [Sclerotinia borealis F-4128]
MSQPFAAQLNPSQHHPVVIQPPSYFSDVDSTPTLTSRNSTTTVQAATRTRTSDLEKNSQPTNSQEIHYRSMTWWQCAAIMIAETISLGILALPSVLATVGLIPGLILILGMGIMAWYSGYEMHLFRSAYPQIHSWADCFEILFTPLGFPNVGREIAFTSIFIAVIVTMVAVGVQAPAEKNYTLWPKEDLSLREAFLSVTNIVFAYGIFSLPPFFNFSSSPSAPPSPPQPPSPPKPQPTNPLLPSPGGHVAFFAFMAELRDPSDFPKSLATLQIIEITLYLLSASIIYIYAGSSVASPALSSAGPLISKIAFGLAIPTIVIAGVIFGHVCSKYVFSKIYHDTIHMTTRTRRGMFSWLGITALLWIVAWVIAESIPVFNELLGLVSALFASWFTYGLAGIFGLYRNKGRWNGGWWMRGLFLCNVGLVGVGAVICGMGLWASGVGIGEGAREGKSWSCGEVGGRE